MQIFAKYFGKIYVGNRHFSLPPWWTRQHWELQDSSGVRFQETLNSTENWGCQDPIFQSNTHNELKGWAQTAGNVEGENDKRKWWWWDEQWTTTGRKRWERKCTEASWGVSTRPARPHHPGWLPIQEASLGRSSQHLLHHDFPARRCPCPSPRLQREEGDLSVGGAQGRGRRSGRRSRPPIWAELIVFFQPKQEWQFWKGKVFWVDEVNCFTLYVAVLEKAGSVKDLDM